MATKTQKFIIGFLTLVVLTATVYILLPNQIRIDVTDTKTTFKVYENNSWVLAGTEYTKIYDGSTLMKANNRVVNYSVDNETNTSTIWRYAYFKDNITVIDTYLFNGQTDDKENVPVSHQIRVINGQNKILQYEVNDLLYFGQTINSVSSPQIFGHNMKVEWESENYYAQIFKYSGKNVGKLTIKYKKNSSDYTENVRLFDPVTLSGLGDYASTNTNVTQENLFTHLNLSDGSLVLYMPFDVIQDSANKTYDYTNNSNDGTNYGGIFNQTGGVYGGAYNFSNGFIKANSLSYLVKSYWINIYGNWQHILVNDTNATYVNGVLVCPSDMAYINKLGGYCIDRYEASTPGCEIVGNNCGYSAETSYCTKCVPTIGVFGSASSSTGTNVTAYSKQNVAPLVMVSQLQARQMCSNAGKHLCTDEEWLGASNVQGKIYNLPTDLAVAPYSCNTGSSTNCNYSYVSEVKLNYACNTSMNKNGISNCSSAEGVYDMTGNVWEWTNETVDTVKTCGDTKVSGSCYINATSMTWQSSSTSPIYGNDYTYFIGNSSTGRAVLRGGLWSHGAYAGPFSAYLGIAPSDLSYGVGFRCCDGFS